MYLRWLDGWDERRAQRGDSVKKPAAFTLDANHAFQDAQTSFDTNAFCKMAALAVRDPTFFEDTDHTFSAFEENDGWISFPSAVKTDVAENNKVSAKVTDSGARNRALIVFHHWNANGRNRQLASFLARRGITVVEIALPYHLERSRPGASYAYDTLSPNLGRTVQSMRQAVLDGRRLISFLKRVGYKEVSVLGMSLGSWVAGLVAAQDLSVSKAALFLTAGSLADMVWTGRATRAIHASLAPAITQATLQQAWAPLDLGNYVDSLARPALKLQVTLAKRDTVVLPEISHQLLRGLAKAGATPDVLDLNCGHYSLAMPPHILIAGWRLQRFLRS